MESKKTPNIHKQIYQIYSQNEMSRQEHKHKTHEYDRPKQHQARNVEKKMDLDAFRKSTTNATRQAVDWNLKEKENQGDQIIEGGQ